MNKLLHSTTIAFPSAKIKSVEIAYISCTNSSYPVSAINPQRKLMEEYRAS